MEDRLSGWTLFKVRGVDVKLHLSLLFLLIYILLVALVQLPSVIESAGLRSEQVSGPSLGWALLFSIAVIFSIFIHELGHVLVAQAKGYQVHRITLMMLGGVSQMERLPEKPKDELKVAIIGPFVSLALAALLFIAREISTSANVDFFCFWLGQTNLILGLFNLLPAFPTDGGRVLRAILVQKQGAIEGTQKAVKVSQVFAWAFGLIGFFQFNFLLVLVALFIYAAAKSELFLLLGQSLLKGLQVKDLVVRVSSLTEEATVADAAEMMIESGNTFLSIESAQENPSVISAENIQMIPNEKWPEIRIKEIKARLPKVIRAEDLLSEVLLLAFSFPIGALPVVEGHRILGIIRKADIIEAIQLRQLSSHSRPLPRPLVPLTG